MMPDENWNNTINPYEAFILRHYQKFRKYAKARIADGTDEHIEDLVQEFCVRLLNGQYDQYQLLDKSSCLTYVQRIFDTMLCEERRRKRVARTNEGAIKRVTGGEVETFFTQKRADIGTGGLLEEVPQLLTLLDSKERFIIDAIMHGVPIGQIGLKMTPPLSRKMVWIIKRRAFGKLKNVALIRLQGGS